MGPFQNELKGKWEVEKSMLEVAKNEAEKKYDEINEQVIAQNAVSMSCGLLDPGHSIHLFVFFIGLHT